MSPRIFANSRSDRHRFTLRFGHSSTLPASRHHSEREIVSVAAFVACLQGVAASDESRAVGQIRKSAADWACGGVVDNRKDCADRKRVVSPGAKDKLRSTLDGYSIGADLIRPALAGKTELALVVASGVEGEEIIDCQDTGSLSSGARKACLPLPVPTATLPPITPVPRRVPPVTCTGPVPVAEPVAACTISVPAIILVPPI